MVANRTAKCEFGNRFGALKRHERQLGSKGLEAAKDLRGQAREMLFGDQSRVRITCVASLDFDLINNLLHAGNALTGVNANLTLVERAHTARKQDAVTVLGNVHRVVELRIPLKEVILDLVNER